MNLIDSKELCEILNISKSTLYRWCSISDDPIDALLSGGISAGVISSNPGRIAQESLDRIKRNNPTYSMISELRKIADNDVPRDFPRPFKIGRSFKWDKVEIFDWLKTKRV